MKICLYERIGFRSFAILALVIMLTGSARWAPLAAQEFSPGNIVLSRSESQGDATTLKVGDPLPGATTTTFTSGSPAPTTTSGKLTSVSGFTSGAPVIITTAGGSFAAKLTGVNTSTKVVTWDTVISPAPVSGNKIALAAVADGTFPGVWTNETPDPSFGVTSPIFLDELTPEGTLVGTTRALDSTQITTSFPSKSELGLNQSQDGSKITFMAYKAAVNTLDVSNSNTPGHPDPTDPVSLIFQRAVGLVDATGSLQVTAVNAYSGNNGRGAALANNGVLYLVGNAGNGSGTEPLVVINNTGVQATTPGGSADTTVIGAERGTCHPPIANGCQYGFTLSDVVDPLSTTTPQAHFGDDKSGKDDNFRSITIFDNTLYVSKGSGSNGIDTVYQVGTPGTIPALADGATTPIAVLNGLPTESAREFAADATSGRDGYYPFGMWFADANTLYVADEGSGATPSGAADNPYAGLEKWVRSNGKWSLAYTLQNGLNLGTPYVVSNYPFNTFAAGLRNLTGRRNDDGTATIWSITSTLSAPGHDQGADPDQLVMITDQMNAPGPTAPAGESFTVLRTARFGEVLRGVSFTPGTINPIWTITRDHDPNADGWNDTDVKVTLTANLADGTIDSIHYTLAGAQSDVDDTTSGNSAVTTVSGEGQTTMDFYAQNAAGSRNATRSLSPVLKIDKTKPNIDVTLTPVNGTGPTGYGWYNSDVDVDFSCSDPLPVSGVASGAKSCGGSGTLTEGQNQSITGTSEDFAGNQNQKDIIGINIDETNPLVSFTGNAGAYTVDQVIAIVCHDSDALSGLAPSTCPGASDPAYSFPLGTTTLDATINDKAGNQSKLSTSFTVGVTFDSLANLTQQFVAQKGNANSLVAKLSAAAKSANKNGKANQLNAYVNELNAQSGKALTTDQAAILIALAGQL